MVDNFGLHQHHRVSASYRDSLVLSCYNPAEYQLLRLPNTQHDPHPSHILAHNRLHINPALSLGLLLSRNPLRDEHYRLLRAQNISKHADDSYLNQMHGKFDYFVLCG